MFRNSHRLPKQLAAAIAVVALAAPATSAAYPVSGNSFAYQDLRNPDSKAAAVEAQREGYQDLRNADSKAAAIEAQRGATETPPPAEVVKAPGFDWADAGIGAGSALGTLLVALSVMFAVVHRRRSAHGSEGEVLTT